MSIINHIRKYNHLYLAFTWAILTFVPTNNPWIKVFTAYCCGYRLRWATEVSERRDKESDNNG